MPDLSDLLGWLVKGLLGLLLFYVVIRIGTMAVLKSYAEYLRERTPAPPSAARRESK